MCVYNKETFLRVNSHLQVNRDEKKLNKAIGGQCPCRAGPWEKDSLTGQ